MAIQTGNRLTPVRLNTRSVRARRTTTQSFANGTAAALSFDAEDWDNAAMFTGSSSSLILPVAGLWGFIGCASFLSNATGYRRLLVDVNSSATFPTIESRPAVNGADTAITISGSHVATGGDSLQLFAHQTSGGALNVIAGAYFTAWLIES